MKNQILLLASALTVLFSCSHPHSHEHNTEEKGLESLSYTVYSDNTELFVEFKPLVIGSETKFAAHFTKLGERFLALEEGAIKLTLVIDKESTSVETNKPEVPGIFRFFLTPTTSGMGKLIFNIKTKDYEDSITIDSINVYADEKIAGSTQPKEIASHDITYLKEQAWNVEFATIPIRKQSFRDVIKTSGQILSAPGDEMLVSAKANGIVIFSGNKTSIGSAVNAGTNLFTISGGDLKVGNIDAAYKETKANFNKAKIDLDRATELVKDKIISQKEFQEIKLNFDNSQTAFNTISKNYSANGISVSSGLSGFVKNIFVSEGQFVEAGTPLASISKNKKLILQANVSQKYFRKLATISSANFRSTESETIYNTGQLNGKVISFGKSVSANSPFIPIIFEFDNTRNIVPGSVVEVFLKSIPISDALLIPISSLIEEQGSFFVYVQIEGERFQKREVKLGASDGIDVQILSGVEEGERIVTKGAYQIKLSQASGTMPAHGHEH